MRIIPTYVGSTDGCIDPAKTEANHSHVCGINQASYHLPQALAESFPRMWDQRAYTL